MSVFKPTQHLPTRKPSPRQVRQFRSNSAAEHDLELEIVAPMARVAEGNSQQTKTQSPQQTSPQNAYQSRSHQSQAASDAQSTQSTTSPTEPVADASAKANYEQILNRANAAICQFRMLADFRLLCDYASAGTEAILGYTPAELQKNPYLWRTQIWPADWDRVMMPALQKLLRVTQADPQRYYKSQVEFRFQRKSGYPGWMTTTLSCRFDLAQQCWHLTIVQIEVPPVDLQRRVVPNHAQAQATLAAHNRVANGTANGSKAKTNGHNGNGYGNGHGAYQNGFYPNGSYQAVGTSNGQARNGQAKNNGQST